MKILIDGFGTGYASLKYLKMLPVDDPRSTGFSSNDLPDSIADEAIVGPWSARAQVGAPRSLQKASRPMQGRSICEQPVCRTCRAFCSPGAACRYTRSRLSEEMVSHSRVAGRA